MHVYFTKFSRICIFLYGKISYIFRIFSYTSICNLISTISKMLIKHTTRMVKSLFSRLEYRVDVNTLAHHETDKLNMNDIARVAMKVQQPLALDHYSRNRFTGSFIVIDEATNNTVAAGMIA